MSNATATLDYASLDAAVSALGSTPATLLISTALSVIANTTVPATLTLEFTGSGSLAVPTGKVVTINGPIQAPLKQIFVLTGSGTVTLAVATDVHPEWWGAVADGVTDSTTAIQSAINAVAAAPSGGRVYFHTGVYIISSMLTIPVNSSIQFEGAGYTLSGAAGVFGDPLWLSGPGLGSFLKMTSTTQDALHIDSNSGGASTNSYSFKNLAFVGPGTGSTSGIVVGSALVSAIHIFMDHVGITNFSVGLYLKNGNSNYFDSMDIRGCTTGILSDAGMEEVYFDNLNMKNCSTGYNGKGSNHTYFTHATFQLGTTAVSFVPTGQIEGNFFKSCFWEGYTTNVLIDATSAGVLWTVFDDCQMSGSGAVTFNGTGNFGITRFTVRNSNWGSVSLAPPWFVGDFLLENTQVNSFSSAGWAAATPSITISGLRTNGTVAKIDKLFSNYPTVLTYAINTTLIWGNGNVQKIVLTGNITFTMPSDAPAGAYLTMIITQDGTGGWTVGWSPAPGVGFVKHAWSDAGNMAGKTSIIQFYNDASGGNQGWRQCAVQTPYL